MWEFKIWRKSVLHSLPRFDVIAYSPVDYMHFVVLGVSRFILSLWFDTKRHREPCLVVHMCVDLCVLYCMFLYTCIALDSTYFVSHVHWKQTKRG